MTGLFTGLFLTFCPTEEPVRVTVVVVLATTQDIGVDKRLVDLAKEVQKRDSTLIGFKVVATEAKSIPVGDGHSFELLEKQVVKVRVERPKDENGRVSLAIRAARARKDHLRMCLRQVLPHCHALHDQERRGADHRRDGQALHGRARSRPVGSHGATRISLTSRIANSVSGCLWSASSGRAMRQGIPPAGTRPMRFVLLLLLFVAIACPSRAADPATEFFEKNVRPVLVEKCLSCHGAREGEGRTAARHRARRC